MTNLQISKTLTRIKQLELVVSEIKTIIVIFTKRRIRIENIPQIRIGEEAINIKQSMKYFGIFLDHWWTFSVHVEYIK